MQEPRKHHYVPQWYLRQFGTKREIAVYDKRAGTLSVMRPKDAAFEVGFYDLDHPQLPRWAFEKVLSNVENHAAPAVRKAISSGLHALTDEEREDIAAFVATQQLRVPSHRSAVAKSLSTTLDRIRARLTDDEIRQITGQDLTLKEMELIRGPSLSSAEPVGVMPYGVSVALSRFMEELLGDYRWSVLTVQPGELITSDTPVKPMTERSADGTPSVFADVPLDPAHVLVLQTGDGGDVTAALGGADAWFRDATWEPSLKCFQNLNFMKAERWVFGHPDNSIWSELGVVPPADR
jgi:hypothetical protein